MLLSLIFATIIAHLAKLWGSGPDSLLLSMLSQ